MKVEALMHKEVDYVFFGDFVSKVIEIMAQKDRGLLPVLDSLHRVVGVISNKDIINKILAKNKDVNSCIVSEFMTRDVVFISPYANLSEAILLMRSHKIKRVLVMENSRLCGIISANDILDGVLAHKKQLLDLAIDF